MFVRKLKYLFIKVEDMFGFYWFCYKEFKKFFFINFELEFGGCLFDYLNILNFKGCYLVKNC